LVNPYATSILLKEKPPKNNTVALFSASVRR